MKLDHVTLLIRKWASGKTNRWTDMIWEGETSGSEKCSEEGIATSQTS